MMNIKAISAENIVINKADNEEIVTSPTISSEDVFQQQNYEQTDIFERNDKQNTARDEPIEESGSDNNSKILKKVLIGTCIGLGIVGSVILLKKTGAINKIKNMIANKNMVDANSKELFSFAKRHPLKAPEGILSEDGMVLTHMTDYLPQKGYIDTARSAVGASRDSVHFAVNHGVTGHTGGCWDRKPYAILTPMKSTLKTAGNDFVGGVAADFYSHGKVKLPKDAVIVRYNAKIPKGKYKILNASRIKELRDLKGVKVIETSEENMKTTVDNIIPRIGYDLKDSSEAWYWGKEASKSRFKEFKRFNKFLKVHNMQPAFHTYTPNGKTEMLIENIMMRANMDRDWEFISNGKVIANSKEEILKNIEYIQQYAQKTKYPLDFNMQQLKEIVLSSKTPKEAVDGIRKTMGINMHMFNENQIKLLTGIDILEQEIFLKSYNLGLVGGKGVSATDQYLLNYIARPCKETLTSALENARTIITKEIKDMCNQMKKINEVNPNLNGPKKIKEVTPAHNIFKKPQKSILKDLKRSLVKTEVKKKEKIIFL